MKDSDFNDFKDSLNQRLTDLSVDVGKLNTNVNHLSEGQKELKAQLDPISKQVAFFGLLAKGTGALAGFVGLCLGVIQLYKMTH